MSPRGSPSGTSTATVGPPTALQFTRTEAPSPAWIASGTPFPSATHLLKATLFDYLRKMPDPKLAARCEEQFTAPRQQEAASVGVIGEEVRLAGGGLRRAHEPDGSAGWCTLYEQEGLIRRLIRRWRGLLSASKSRTRCSGPPSASRPLPRPFGRSGCSCPVQDIRSKGRGGFPRGPVGAGCGREASRSLACFCSFALRETRCLAYRQARGARAHPSGTWR